MPELKNRTDLMLIANTADFKLRHFARGFYPCTPYVNTMSVNRLFFPLANPEGNLNYISDAKRKYPLRPGYMYFIPAYCPSAWCLSGKLEFLSIHFNDELFPGTDLFSGCSSMLEMPVPQDFPELPAVMDASQNDWRTALKADVMVRKIAISFLFHYPEKDFVGPLALRAYRPLLDFLAENASAKIAVSDLATQMKMSREYFSRTFSKNTGMTPKQLIDRFIVQKAMQFLLQGLSVKETADRLQFNTPFIFSRFFHRETGAPPRLWQKQNSVDFKNI